VQTIEIEQIFDFPLEKLIEIRTARYTYSKLWPEILESKIIEKNSNNEKIVEKRMTRIGIAHDSPISRVLKNSSLELEEKTVFDIEKNVYILETKLKNSPLILNILEKTIHTEMEVNGQLKSKRVINISAEIKIPIIGLIIEKALLSELARQSSNDQKRMNKFLESNSTE
jgi:hypothetical protein